MPEQSLQRTTIGLSNFRKARDSGCLFVDKTAKIPQLVQYPKVFFSRPRRMGKTTLIEMLHELFAHGAQGNKYFDGLAVQNLWPEQKCYPVIFVSLYALSNPDSFESELRARLISAFDDAGFEQVVSETAGVNDLPNFLVLLKKIIKGTDVVWLIDEWDFPLSSNLNELVNFERIRNVLRVFFGWLRILNEAHFTLVTGIARYRDTSLFSGQDIVDISMDPLFGDLVGYTQDEIKANFAPHIAAAARLLHCSEDELLQQLKYHYDGFCFDADAKFTLYSPWSVNNFFQQVVLKPSERHKLYPYWMESSNAPASIRNYLDTHHVDLSFLDDIEDDGIEIIQNDIVQPASVEYLQSHRFELKNFAALMVQTGYLSIRKVVDPAVTNPYVRRLRCFFPNNEVESVYAYVFLRYITDKWGMADSWFIKTAQELHDAMYAQDIAAVVHELNLFFTAIPYDIWAHAKETSFRTYTCWALIFSQVSDRVREETFNYKGRSDIELQFEDKFYVFELKRLPAHGSDKTALKLADAAHKQIKARQYGHNSATLQQARVNERYGLVLVIAEDTRQVRYWRLIALEQGQELKSGWVDPMPEPVRTREAVVEVTAVQNVVSEASASDSVANAREDKNAVDQAAAVVHDDDVIAAPQNAAPALSAPVSSSHEPATKPQAASSKPQASASKSAVPPQEQELRTTIQLLIELAAEHANDKNLVTIDPDQLTTRMISLYAKLKQAGTQFSRAGLTSMVRAVISASEATNESAAIKLDRAFLTDQLIATLQDQL